MIYKIPEKILAELECILRLKFRYTNEVLEHTKELGNIDTKDYISLRIILQMRGQALENCMLQDRFIEDVLKRNSYEDDKIYRLFIKGEQKEVSLYGDDIGKNILLIIDKINGIKKQTLEVDRDLNERLLGEESYYRK